MKPIDLLMALFFVCLFILIACSKNDRIEEPPISQEEISNCHRIFAWDSVKISEHLIGKWNWEYISCFWFPDDANSKDHAGLVVEFKSDQKLNVFVNDEHTQISTWSLKSVGDEIFELELNPTVEQLYGRILFCSDRVEFFNSYIDGCDNYFIKD